MMTREKEAEAAAAKARPERAVAPAQ